MAVCLTVRNNARLKLKKNLNTKKRAAQLVAFFLNIKRPAPNSSY